MITKKSIGKLIILTLILILCKIIIKGENGFCYLAQLKDENNNLLEDILKLENEKIKKIDEIKNLEDKPFYSEKIARENLQMANLDDHIFLIVKKERE